MTWKDTRGFLLLNGLSPRDRRAILIGLAILVPAALYVLGVKPYRSALEGARDRVSAERELLARELALLESSDSFPEAIQRAQEQADLFEDRLVRAASGELAEGELTDFLERSALRSRVLLEEIRSGELGRGEAAPAGLEVVRLHLRGESDLEGVLTFLDAIETSRLLLRVRGLALEPQVARSESGDEEDSQGAPMPTGVIEFQLIIDGFARLDEVARAEEYES